MNTSPQYTPSGDGEGERANRCRWQIKGGERVAAVEKIKDSASPLIFSGTAIGKFAKVTSVWVGDEGGTATS